MDEVETQNVRALIAGILIAQKALVELLIRSDALSFHQARDTLQGALTSLKSSEEDIDAVTFRPMEDLLRFIDDVHRPLDVGQKPEAANWPAELARSLAI